MARGDKAASGTLQMQALAEWRLDGEQGQAEAFDNAADVYRRYSRMGHLLGGPETSDPYRLARMKTLEKLVAVPAQGDRNFFFFSFFFLFLPFFFF